MKNIYCLFLLLLLMSMNACKNDPALVNIPGQDGSKPILYWELMIETQGSGGPKMSTNTFKDPRNVTTLHRSDNAHLYLIADDHESGIRHASLGGEFDFLCLNPQKTVEGTNSHGSVPGQAINFDMMTTKAHRQWRLDGNKLLCNFECGTGYEYSKGKFEIKGVAVNQLKDTSTSVLTIQVIN